MINRFEVVCTTEFATLTSWHETLDEVAAHQRLVTFPAKWSIVDHAGRTYHDRFVLPGIMALWSKIAATVFERARGP